jgi:pimeloyl-ACP methyl ester carboxylesterase
MKNSTPLVGLCLAVILLLFGLSNQLYAQVVAKTVVASTGQIVPFLQYIPSTHNVSPPTRKYPMIIFLHGGGERSNNTALLPAPPTTPYAPVWQLTAYGPLRERGWHNLGFTWNNQTDTCIVIHPLSKDTITWPVAYINAVIDYGIDSLKADSNRIYLAGHSYGGAGVFNYLNSSGTNVNRLAAAVPIAAWNTALNSTGANYVSNARLPVWAFHALNDANTSPSMTINSISTLNAVNPQVKPLVTLWPSGTIIPHPHNSAPDYVFNLHQYPYLEDGVINIYEWFLGQNKSLPPNVLPVANAGPDQTIALSPGTATLNGTGSSDADGIVRYFWRQISGPASITITNTHTTSTAAAAAYSTKSISGLTVAGTYEFELSVVDARAGISKDIVQITAGTPPPGKAISINTTGGRILAGNVSQLKNAAAFTLEAYVKYDGTVTDWSNGEACIVRNYITATDRVKLTIDKATNSVHFTVANGADVEAYTASNVVTPNTWYHIAGVYDGAQAVNTNRLKIYINGVSQTLTFSGTIPATTSGSTPAYLFGGEPSASKVVAIDEVRVWTTALPQATIDSWKDKLLGNCHPNFNKLTVYWPLDDGASPSASAGLGTAYTGGLLNATYVSSPLIFDTNPCPPGKAISITTTGGRILAGNVSQLKNAAAFTLEAYVKYDGTVTDWSNGEACIVRNYITATDRVKLTIDKATNSVHFTVANGADVEGYTASNVVTPNTWYHIAGVYDGAQAVNTNRLKIYINGVSQTLTFSGTIPATTSGSTPAYLFGGEPSASKVVAIDEVRVWTTALPQATIDSWKDKLLGNCHPNFNKLTVYWPLDDGASPSASAGLGTAYTGGLLNATYITSNQAIDASGCGARMMLQAVPEGLQAHKLAIGKVYPNPTKDVVQIELNTTMGKSVIINVLDLLGRQLIRNSKLLVNGTNRISLNIASLPAGIYIIEVRDGNTIIGQHRVLKQ